MTTPKYNEDTRTAWAHLPNANHIDRVLAHIHAHPNFWLNAIGVARDAARDAARVAAWTAAWDAARSAARDEAWNTAWFATHKAARDVARDEVWNTAWFTTQKAARNAAWFTTQQAARSAARDAARDAVAALIAWDESHRLLYMPPDNVRALWAIGSDAALLLLPASIAMQGVNDA